MKIAWLLVAAGLVSSFASPVHAGWWHHHHRAYYAPYAAYAPVAVPFAVPYQVPSNPEANSGAEAALTRALTESFSSALRANANLAANPNLGNQAGNSPTLADFAALQAEVQTLKNRVDAHELALTTIPGDIAALKQESQASKALARRVVQLETQLLPKPPGPVQKFVASPEFKTMLESILKRPGIKPEDVLEALKAELSKSPK